MIDVYDPEPSNESRPSSGLCEVCRQNEALPDEIYCRDCMREIEIELGYAEAEDA